MGRVIVWKKLNSGCNWWLRISVWCLVLLVVVSSIGVLIKVLRLIRLNRCLSRFG